MALFDGSFFAPNSYRGDGLIGRLASSTTTGVSINNAAQGGGGSHANVPPTICCNFIIRII